MTDRKTKRKIVQITGVNRTVAALCDDGSVWLLAITSDEDFSERRWEMAPSIESRNDRW